MQKINELEMYERNREREAVDIPFLTYTFIYFGGTILPMLNFSRIQMQTLMTFFIVSISSFTFLCFLSQRNRGSLILRLLFIKRVACIKGLKCTFY